MENKAANDDIRDQELDRWLTKTEKSYSIEASHDKKLGSHMLRKSLNREVLQFGHVYKKYGAFQRREIS